MRWSSLLGLLPLTLICGCMGEVVIPPPPGGSSSGGRGAVGSTSASTSTAAGASSSSTGSSSSSAAASTTGSTAAASSSTGGSTGGSTGSGCASDCGANARCEAGACVCAPGFTAGPSGCDPVAAGDPTTHTQAEVCQAWRDGHVQNAPAPFTPGAAACDPGSLSPQALDDALRRLDMFRWMIGLGPVTDDPQSDANDQACAVIAANNPASAAAHYPDASWTCYSSAGAAGAGSSNIAWGCGSAADAMDQWIQDWGNETTLGHRRWMFNPPLDHVGIGFVSGGSGQWGSASCLGVFGGGNPNPDPLWTAYPPPGFVPIDAVYSIWSLHSDQLGVGGAQVSITQLSDGANVPVTMQPLSGGYGTGATSWTLANGTGVRAGETYRVSVTNVGGASDWSYDVSVVSCP